MTVPLRIEDVRMWAVDQNHVGHVVMWTKSPWLVTLCGQFANHTQTPEQPKRICRRCRKEMPLAKPIVMAA